MGQAIVEFLQEHTLVEVFAAVITLFFGVFLGAVGSKRRARREELSVLEDNEEDTMLAQSNALIREKSGELVLLTRNIPGFAHTGDLLKNNRFSYDRYVSLIEHSRVSEPVVPFKGSDGRHLLRKIIHHFASACSQCNGEFQEWLAVVTHEERGLCQSSRIRVLMIREKDLSCFSDPKVWQAIRVENPEHYGRILSLVKIAERFDQERLEREQLQGQPSSNGFVFCVTKLRLPLPVDTVAMDSIRINWDGIAGQRAIELAQVRR